MTLQSRNTATRTPPHQPATKKRRFTEFSYLVIIVCLVVRRLNSGVSLRLHAHPATQRRHRYYAPDLVAGGIKRYRDPSVCLSHGAAELPRLQTVESYMVIICQQSLSDNSHTCYYRYSITHSLFHSRLKTFLFCKSFPLQPFLFSFRIHYMDFPDCLLLLLSIFRLLLFSFSVLTLFSCPFRAVD